MTQTQYDLIEVRNALVSEVIASWNDLNDWTGYEHAKRKETRYCDAHEKLEEFETILGVI
jgi:hypothetical protein